MTHASEKRMKVHFSCIISLFERLSQEARWLYEAEKRLKIVYFVQKRY